MAIYEFALSEKACAAMHRDCLLLGDYGVDSMGYEIDHINRDPDWHNRPQNACEVSLRTRERR
jgi:hypothetical protein